jgi:hypothetical protein
VTLIIRHPTPLHFYGEQLTLDMRNTHAFVRNKTFPSPSCPCGPLVNDLLRVWSSKRALFLFHLKGIKKTTSTLTTTRGVGMAARRHHLRNTTFVERTKFTICSHVIATAGMDGDNEPAANNRTRAGGASTAHVPRGVSVARSEWGQRSRVLS